MDMEVFYEGKEKLKKSKMGFEAFRHNFTVELEDEECFPFHVNEPDPYAIHLDSEICTAKGHILFGTAVLEAHNFIKKTMDAEMEKHKSEVKNEDKM